METIVVVPKETEIIVVIPKNVFSCQNNAGETNVCSDGIQMNIWSTK